MGWSTRELAELAGTTVNSIRHYHRVGLLELPERRSNGYKQYQARHLSRVIQIRRLRELGVPLAEVESLGAREGDVGAALRTIDAELEAGIERFQRARAELAILMRDPVPLDVPPGYSSVAGRLNEADRSLITIYTQFFDQAAMDDIRRMIDTEPDDVERDYNALPPDADDSARQRLAERLAPLFAQHLADFPWLRDNGPHLSARPEVIDSALRQAMPDLYSAAQRDVLRRATIIAHSRRDADGP